MPSKCKTLLFCAPCLARYHSWAQPTQCPCAVGVAAGILEPSAYIYNISSIIPLFYKLPRFGILYISLKTKCTCCRHTGKVHSGPAVHMEFIRFWAERTELMS